MLFTRPATAEDFEKDPAIQIRDYRYLSRSAMRLLDAGDFRGAVDLTHEETGMSRAQIAPHCRTYQAYLQAKRDFQAGKPVFVAY